MHILPLTRHKEGLHTKYVPALRLPPVGLLVEEKAKEDPPVPTPPNPGPPPPKPAEESDRGSQCSAPAHRGWLLQKRGVGGVERRGGAASFSLKVRCEKK